MSNNTIYHREYDSLDDIYLGSIFLFHFYVAIMIRTWYEREREGENSIEKRRIEFKDHISFSFQYMKIRIYTYIYISCDYARILISKIYHVVLYLKRRIKFMKTK